MKIAPAPPKKKSILETGGLFAPKPVEIEAAIRVGSVPYLNAKPLTQFIASPVSFSEPSQLAADLRAEKMEVALVPLMEVLEAPEGAYRVVDKIAIGSEHAVYSVYLHYAVPIQKIRTVALDPASKTSVELARIVLEKFHRLAPRYVAPDAPADARLLIGDPAIHYRQVHPQQNYLDLATAWREYTGLPFVFAVWALRLPYWKATSVARQLRTAAKLGLSARHEIGHTPFERHYLTKHLCYDLGASQKKAVTLFGQMLAQAGRIKAAPKLSYL